MHVSRNFTDILQNTNKLYSVCLPPGYTGVHTFDDVTYDITASMLPRPHSVYDVCTVIATVFLDLAECGPIRGFPEVNSEEFYVLEKGLRHSVRMGEYYSLPLFHPKSAKMYPEFSQNVYRIKSTRDRCANTERNFIDQFYR